MRREKNLLFGLSLLAAALCLSACGAGVRPASASSDEDTGQIHVDQAAPGAPTSYTTQAGDTLKAVAARPEIYGDPDLWPLLKDANAESLEGKSADSPLSADLELEVPRGSTPEALAAAREEARAYASRRKAGAEARPSSGTDLGLESGAVPSGRPSSVHVSAPARKPARHAEAFASAPSSAPSAAPVPVHARGAGKMTRIYLLLALVLAALAAVFYVFFQRDKRDFD